MKVMNLAVALSLLLLGGSAAAVQHDMAAAPGPLQQALAKRAGEYTTKSSLSGPGMPASEATGTAKITTALDGRFIQEQNSGTFAGQPIAGMRLYGYNGDSQKYEAVWTYTMSTGIMKLVGTSPDGGKTVNYTASYDDAKGTQTLQVVVRQIDDDHFVVEMTAKMPDGSEGPKLVENYARKK